MEQSIGESILETCVLVVCNEKDLAMTMREALLSADFSVQVAHNAPDALNRITVKKPDLIVLDMMLQRIGGIALLQMLQKSPAAREIPVILTTARTSPTSRRDALDAGADAFMSKPFTNEDFLSLVHEFLPLQSHHPAS